MTLKELQRIEALLLVRHHTLEVEKRTLSKRAEIIAEEIAEVEDLRKALDRELRAKSAGQVTKRRILQRRLKGL